MRTSSRRAAVIGSTMLAAGALTVGTTLAAVPVAGGQHDPAYQLGSWQDHQQVQVLAFNDFHGALEPGDLEVDGQPVGGVEYLATHLQQLRQGNQHSATVAAGDLIGGAPPLSEAFYDEPTIDALNAIGLDAASVGSREFDDGWQELLRKQHGGCREQPEPHRSSCPDRQAPFQGADFDYLSANVFGEDSGDTLLPPYTIETFGANEVAFVGMTLEDTPNIVTADGVDGLEFTDEVETANALVPELTDQGVQAIVVLLHQGARDRYGEDPNGCEEPVGPAVDIAENLDPEIDAVISGHTHRPYVCSIPDPNGDERLLTSADSGGAYVTEIDLALQNETGEVIREQSTATNHLVTRDVDRDPELVRVIDRYNRHLGPIENEPIGEFSDGGAATRSLDESQESRLGNLLADAMRADPSVAIDGRQPDVALMNPDGMHADLDAHPLRYGDALAVLPDANYLVSMDITGADLLGVLSLQWDGANSGQDPGWWDVLGVSGLTYTWEKTPGAAETVRSSVRVNGEPLDPNARYRVVTNSFLAEGRDSFPAFDFGTDLRYGGLEVDALAAFLEANSPYELPPTDRIDRAE